MQLHGYTILFTGLPESGKTTLLNEVSKLILPKSHRKVYRIDAEPFRKTISKELGFSKEDRMENLRRVASVVENIVTKGNIALCAFVAPYQEIRQIFKNSVEKYGKYYLVYVATPLEECISRDSKGLYSLANSDRISEFTGTSSPYEKPIDYDIAIDTTNKTPKEAALIIVETLRLNKV